MPTLGDIVGYGCFKGDKKLNGVQYCHNCKGDNVRWTWEVMDDEGELMGHVETRLNCKGVNMNESQQKAAMRASALQQVRELAAPGFGVEAVAASAVSGPQHWRTAMSLAGTTTLDPGVSVLSASTLGGDLTNLASAALLAQAHGLVLLRQADVAGLPDLNGLATTVLHQQGEMRAHANYLLDRLVPDTIRQVTDTTAAASLFTGLRTVLLPMAESFESDSAVRTQMSQVATAFANNFENYLDDATDLANEVDREASAVAAASESLEAAVSAVTAALDGPSGAIAKKQDEVAALREAIDVDINNIVIGGKEIGSGIKDLVTGVLTSFNIGGDDKKKPDEKGGGEGEPEGGSKEPVATATAKTVSAEEGGTQTLQSIDTVSDGFGKMSEAQEKLKQDNALLAAGYQELAQLNTLLAVARAIGDQVASYAGSMKQLAAAAATVMRTQSSITAGAEKFATEVHDDTVTASTVVAILNTGQQSWNRIGSMLGPIRQTLAGAGTLIPPAPAAVVSISTGKALAAVATA